MIKNRCLQLVCCSLFLLCSIAILSAQLPARGIIISGDLRVRTTSSLEGRVLGHLDEGETVEILKRSEEKMPIGDMLDFWYEIKTDRLEGWIYGYFLSLDKLQFPVGLITVFFGQSMDDPLRTFYHAFFASGDRKFSSYEVRIIFSGSGIYYLENGRQDVVGQLAVYDTISGALLMKDRFTGKNPEWQGDGFSYESVVRETDDGDLVTKMNEFINGPEGEARD